MLRLKKVLIVIVVAAASIAVTPNPFAVAEPNEGATPAVADAQRRITAGGLHTCAVTDSGHVQCWGQNDNGQLGNGTTSVRTKPQLVSGISTALGVSGGSTHTCALIHDGTVRCWGNNGNGQLGNGSTSPPAPPVLAPVQVSGIDDATAIASGGFHTCALRAGGTVSCWGHNGSGQLGDGSGLGTSYVPVGVRWDHDANWITPAVPLTGVSAVTAGEYHSCAIRSTNGGVVCWGHNGFGQLGDDSTNDRSVGVAVKNLPDDDDHADHDPHKAIAITAGEGHTCAVLDDNTARCWGHNFYGQLGNNAPFPPTSPPEVAAEAADDADSHVPVTVVYDDDPSILGEDMKTQGGIVSISAGQFHTCVALVSGSARCWGQNGRSQLGDNNPLDGDHPKNKNRAVPVSGLVGARAVTAGGFHTCALLTSNSMSCWGYNFYGQLGHHRESVLIPETVTALSGAVSVATGDDHACALRTGADPEEKPVCWGRNANGELGAKLTPSPADSTIPVAVFGITDTGAPGADAVGDRTKILTAGNEHACALPAPAGTPVCWGRNVDGELGNNTNAGSDQPVNVTTLSAATQISAGGELFSFELGHTCARAWSDSSSAWCWGDNTYGQLGDESTTDRNKPVRVRSDHDDDHLNTPPPAITPPVDLTDVVEVAAGGRHSCARLGSGRVRCWGRNFNGQLGDGTTIDRAYAVTVDTDPLEPDEDETEDKHFVPLTGVTAITAGARHSCAIKSDNTVWCWGFNDHGQLGNGTNVSRDVPGKVSLPINNIPLAISAGDFHTCLRVQSKNAGTFNSISVMCWGANNQGQLGNNSTGDSAVPVMPNRFGFPSGDAAGTDLVKVVSAGRNNTCLALIDLTVSCSGNNSFGQVGDGVGQRSPVPIAVESLSSVGGNAIPAPVDDTATIVVPPPPAVPIIIDVLANDTDADNNALSVGSVQNPTPRGTATTDGATVTYTPNANFCTADPTSNTDTFTYTATDGIASVPASVTVTVNCLNTAPDTEPDSATTAEEVAKSIAVTANDSDINGDTVTVAAGTVSTPANGTAVIEAGSTSILYTPNTNFVGVDTFTYRATDGTAQSAPETVTVTVTNVNDAPVAVDDVDVPATEDTPTTINVTANDTDVDGPSIAVTSASDPAHGSAQPSGGTAVSYTPDANYCGSDTFTYTLSDGALTDTATVTVSVACANDGPNAVDDAATTSEDNSVVIQVLSNDTDPENDPLEVTAVGQPAHGTATIDAAKTSVTYAPNANFCGADSFSYTISEGSETDTALVVPVVVLCTNDAPVAVADSVTVAEDDSATIEALTNDVDVDGDLLTLVSATAPSHGTASLASNAVLVYEPGLNYCGSDSFDYTMTDPSGLTSTTTVSVTVSCTNDAPRVSSISNQVTPWKALLTVPLGVIDPDAGDSATYALIAPPAGASVVETSPGVFQIQWTPTSTQVGTHSLTVRGTDSGGATDDETFSVTVTKRMTTLTWAGATGGQYSDPAVAGALLTDVDGTPIAGVPVSLRVGTRTRTVTSDANGLGSGPITIGDPAGTSSAAGSFAGDAAFNSSSVGVAFAIAKEKVAVTYLSPSVITTSGAGSTAQLVASVAEEADGSIGSAIGSVTVTFRQVGGPVLCVASVAVSAPGAGTATCTTASLPVGARAITALPSATSYAGDADIAGLAISRNLAGTAAGAGRVAGSSGLDAFAFTATPGDRKTPPSGGAVHVIKGAGSTATVVSSGSISSLSKACTGGKTKTCTATVDTAAGTSVVVDLTTASASSAVAGGTLKVTASDAVEPDGAGADTYAVTIGAPTSYSLASVPIASGNVRVL